MRSIQKIGKALFLSLCFLTSHGLNAQYLLESSARELSLQDELSVTVLSSRDCQECYYYLPTQFRYSINQDSVPEISFVSWKNDEQSETIGAILHFLTTWGLTASQEEALQFILTTEVDSNAVLMGGALVESPEPEAKIKLTGKEEYKELFEAALTSQSLLATTPGGKMAMSFRFDEKNVGKVLKLLSKPDNVKTELSIRFKYQVLSSPNQTPDYRYLNLKLPLSYLFKMIRANQ